MQKQIKKNGQDISTRKKEIKQKPHPENVQDITEQKKNEESPIIGYGTGSSGLDCTYL